MYLPTLLLAMYQLYYQVCTRINFTTRCQLYYYVPTVLLAMYQLFYQLCTHFTTRYVPSVLLGMHQLYYQLCTHCTYIILVTHLLHDLDEPVLLLGGVERPGVPLVYTNNKVTFLKTIFGAISTEHSSSELRVIETNAYWVDTDFLHLTIHT